MSTGSSRALEGWGATSGVLGHAHRRGLGDTVAALLVDTARRLALEERDPVYCERYDWVRVARLDEDMYGLAQTRLLSTQGTPGLGHESTGR